MLSPTNNTTGTRALVNKVMLGMYTFWIGVCILTLVSMYCSNPGFVPRNRTYVWERFSNIVRELYRCTAIHKEEMPPELSSNLSSLSYKREDVMNDWLSEPRYAYELPMLRGDESIINGAEEQKLRDLAELTYISKSSNSKRNGGVFDTVTSEAFD
jgi:hypothetical protein